MRNSKYDWEPKKGIRHLSILLKLTSESEHFFLNLCTSKFAVSRCHHIKIYEWIHNIIFNHPFFWKDEFPQEISTTFFQSTSFNFHFRTPNWSLSLLLSFCFHSSQFPVWNSTLMVIKLLHIKRTAFLITIPPTLPPLTNTFQAHIRSKPKII